MATKKRRRPLYPRRRTSERCSLGEISTSTPALLVGNVQLCSRLALCLGVPPVVAGRRGDGRMAHDLLDRGNVGAGVKQIPGKGAS